MKIGIVGYGNLGRGVEAAVMNAPDMELAGVFTRRDPATVDVVSGAPVLPYDALLTTKGAEAAASEHEQNSACTESAEHEHNSACAGSSEHEHNSACAESAVNLLDQIDVLIICGGSATDLPTMTPELAARYNVIDSFDNHGRIPEHFKNVDAASGQAGKVAIISCGWDPGYFSIARIYSDAALPNGRSYTFWGRGVSQGHSDAIRRIEGVVDARQYTVPVEAALERVREGEHPEFTRREMHLRECYVVAEEGADLERIEREIVTMPDYFADYDTTVTFVSSEELEREHSGLPHGGSVIHSGRTGGCSADDPGSREGLPSAAESKAAASESYNNTIEFKLNLESNPYFTGSILTAAARAAYRMNQEGQSGARTLFDVPPAYLSTHSQGELLAHML